MSEWKGEEGRGREEKGENEGGGTARAKSSQF